jgi:Asp-tRNA(Asn)/Glu-tRNA(Gln) amidotransferase A subunit family amidase
MRNSSTSQVETASWLPTQGAEFPSNNRQEKKTIMHFQYSGRPTLTALALLSTLTLVTHAEQQQQQLFDPREATISSVHNALYSGESCRSIISSFLSRIQAMDRHYNINSVISLDAEALSIATDHDRLFTASASNNSTANLGPLFCVPVLVKDNFDTASLPTTSGSLVLSDSRPSVDAAAIHALKQAGAIILGKTNLQEFALEGISVSSLGGQTVNPYAADRTPGGSSGGSGAAVAASFAVLAMGSDTINSIRNPASANGLFGLRPTRGLISRVGLVPNSHTQDAVGPIARCVEDLAISLSALAVTSEHVDAEDNSTALVPEGVRGTDYHRELTVGSLVGKRIGVLETFFDRNPSNETTPVNEAMDAMIENLQRAGVTVVPINDPRYNVPSILASCETRKYELRQKVDEYLSRPSLGGQHPKTLKDVYTEGNRFLVLPQQYAFIKAVLDSSTQDAEYETVLNNIKDLTAHLHETFATERLDAIIYPQQKNLPVRIGAASQHGRNGILAAVAGFPSLALPAGFSAATDSAPVGIPIGLELMGLPWTEVKLLQIAYRVQALVQIRKPPVWARRSIAVQSYDAVPGVEPKDSNSISSAYPIGVLV